MSVAEEVTHCTWCEEPLTPEERLDPRTDGGDAVICDECHREDFQFQCCRCNEWEDDEHQHERLVVTQPVSAGCGDQVQPGIYRIVKKPYYGGPLLGPGYMCADALERLRDVPEDIDTWPFPCGHLCRECQAKAGPPVETE